MAWAERRHPRDLSSGERERLALASVAVAEPDLLVLDEPTRGLDPERKERLSPPGSRSTPRPERPCSSRPTTATSPHTAEKDFVFQKHKRSRSAPLASRVAGLCAAAALALAAWAALDPARGGIATLLAALAVLAAGFAWLEGGTVTARDLTLVATLGGLAAAGRVLFAPIPSVQPVTVIVAAAGVALGPRRGFAVGALAAIASNFFLGQGPHTPWQMLAWGGCGLLAGLLRPFLRRRLAFVAFVLVLGFAFGMLMDTWLWFAFYPHTEAALLARLACGRPVQHRPRVAGTSCSRWLPGRS